MAQKLTVTLTLEARKANGDHHSTNKQILELDYPAFVGLQDLLVKGVQEPLRAIAAKMAEEKAPA